MTIASLLLALIVTTAADTPSGEPVLLDFHASWCGPCKDMRPEIAKLTAKKYPIQSIDIDQSPELAARYGVTKVPTFIVADIQGQVLARTQGFQPATQLAVFYNKATAQTNATAHRETQATAEQAPGDFPPGDDLSAGAAPSNPLPWETVVRIKMHLSSKEWGFGSGTIIYSDENESIILTCAHIFRDARGQQQALQTFKTPISVDLFDGKNINYKKPQLHCTERDIVGEAIDYDFNNDVGLIRIRPGRRLPFSRVVSDSWKPQRGMKMYSVGCSHGNDATAWDTRILDPTVKMKGPGNQTFYEMKCENQPAEGRSGGGLYTTDGFVAGVCDFADPAAKVGLYAVPKAIHNLLDRNKLMALYKAPSDGSGPLLAATKANGTKYRAQSADEPTPSSEPKHFTIPDPDSFKITPPATRVASNVTNSSPWRDSDAAESRKPDRSARRPDRDQGVLDPGPKGGATLTDLAMEPSSDSAVLDLPDPQAATSKPTSTAANSQRATGNWKRVHTTRPRPERSN